MELWKVRPIWKLKPANGEMWKVEGCKCGRVEMCKCGMWKVERWECGKLGGHRNAESAKLGGNVAILWKVKQSKY